MAEPTGISADFIHVDRALKHLWMGFAEQESAIASFKALPPSAFESFRQETLEDLRRKNPGSDDDSLTVLLDWQVDRATNPRAQFDQRFWQPMMTTHITVVLLAQALCEALINAVMAIGLVQADQEAVFPLIDRAEIKDKWRAGPKVFSPQYSLEPGSTLSETLEQLTRRRNAVVHYKVDLHVGEKQVLKGSNLDVFTYEENLRWTKRFFSLPYDLALHVHAQVPLAPFALMLDREPIPIAEAHRAFLRGKT